MAAYYNEHDRFAAAWLRELIRNDLIAAGEVDERSIEDVSPADLAGFTQCHFFAGIGVWSHALRQAGFPDDRPVWTGSCPCQPFSIAGRQQGLADPRHLWPVWYQLIRACRPVILFGEQVASDHGLAWLDLVQTDLETADYASGAVDLCAAGFGAPHIRQRLWWVAYAHGAGPQGWCAEPEGAAECVAGPRGLVDGFWRQANWIGCTDGRFRPVEPGTLPLADGAAARVGRIRGYGNAINAEVATAFITACL